MLAWLPWKTRCKAGSTGSEKFWGSLAPSYHLSDQEFLLTTSSMAREIQSKICHNSRLHKYRPGGEIGRLRGLKIPRRKACRFESGPGHHLWKPRNHAGSKRIKANPHGLAFFLGVRWTVDAVSRSQDVFFTRFSF